MLTLGRSLAVLIVAWTLLAEAQDSRLTPAEQYQALRQEYDRAASSGVPLTDAQRLRFVGQVYKQRSALAQKFLDLAEKYPSDPVALDAMIQAVAQVNTTPWPVELVGEEPARARAFALLQRDRLDSDKLGPLCERISHGFCKEYEAFLRAVLARNPHREVQAMACLALGRFLHNRWERVALCREDPRLAGDFVGLYGQDYLNELLRKSDAAVRQEIAAYFERAEQRYGDVQLPGDGFVREQAQQELFALRSLSVGQEAPEIAGEDQDGLPFRLRDYRGKVVLLDFWSYV